MFEDGALAERERERERVRETLMLDSGLHAKWSKALAPEINSEEKIQQEIERHYSRLPGLAMVALCRKAVAFI